MTRGQRILAIVLLALLGSALLLNCNRKSGEYLDFGVVVPLSGDSSNYGKSAQQGIDLAVKEINNAGGVMGRKLRPIYEDDKAVARDGASATQKLINVDRVPVIIGGIVSAVTLAAAPICESNKVVWLSPSSSAPAITNAGEFIFRNWPSDDLEGKIMADFIHSRGFKRVGILQVQNDYGEGIAKVFRENFEGQGGTIAILEKYRQDETDFRSLLTKIFASNPDAIYCIGYYTDVALTIRQAREQGSKLQFFATTTVEDPQFIKIGGSSVEGVIYPLASGYDAESQDPNVQRFKSAFKEEYNEDPGFVAAQCYDCIYLIKQATENGKGFSGPDIQKGMSQIQNFPGVTGLTSFDANGDVIKTIRLKVVRDGKFTPYQ